jgi:ADP-ribose pyrophosphatase YjhB (NUDIX family)
MTKINFCIQCGTALRPQIPVGDSRERMCCPACGYIHYRNPAVLVSCMVSWQGKALWMRRANQPRAGLWGAPMGFMEEGETPRAAAARELREETLVDIPQEKLSLYIVGALTHMNEIHIVFRGEMNGAFHGVGEEALEVALMAEDEMPWGQFAYPEVEEQTRRYYQELRAGKFGIYLGEIDSLGIRQFPSAID